MLSHINTGEFLTFIEYLLKELILSRYLSLPEFWTISNMYRHIDFCIRASVADLWCNYVLHILTVTFVSKTTHTHESLYLPTGKKLRDVRVEFDKMVRLHSSFTGKRKKDRGHITTLHFLVAQNIDPIKLWARFRHGNFFTVFTEKFP